MTNAFIERLAPAPVGGGFAMDDYWVWCGSVIRAEDGRYHMFASRWPKGISFSPHWVTNSEVVRAVADRPEGPYEFVEVVLPSRGGDAWDGKMTHNPTIHKSGDTYLLFYTGTNYPRPMPTPENPLPKSRDAVTSNRLKHLDARLNQRIGLATAPSVEGPWTRRAAPVVDVRPGKWDGCLTSNPAPCVLDGDAVLMVYKAVGKPVDLLRMGVARAEHFDGPYERLTDGPIFDFDATNDHVEDAFVWRGPDGFELVMKDMAGGVCGEKGGGIHATSPDGVEWTVSDPPKAWSRRVKWDDGRETVQPHLERPQLLIENGRPTHLFAATCDGDSLQTATRTWNMVIPLKRN